MNQPALNPAAAITPIAVPDQVARHSARLLESSLPRVLLERVRETPDRVACRVKWRGLYRDRTWRDLVERSSQFAATLVACGFAAGDRLAIIGDACEHWLIADLACQCLGGISVGIYPTASVAEVEYQIRDAGARVAVVENQEYLDKLVGPAAASTSLADIFVCDDAALFAYDDSRIKRFPVPSGWRPDCGASDPAADGAGGDGQTAIAWLEQCARGVGPRDPAFIVYTSGTTGNPKGALISHGRHLAGAYNIVAHYPLLASEGLRTVVHLPLCHVLGRDVAVTLPLLCGLTPHYGESVEDLPLTLFEVAPQVLFTVPRYLQKFASQLLIGVSNASPLKSWVFNRALEVARAALPSRWRAHAPGMVARLAHQLAFRPALNKIGFDQLALVISGGAPLPAQTASFWHMLGVNVCEMYGQTETAGAIVSGQRSPFPQPGNVGEVAWGIDLRLRPAAHESVRASANEMAKDLAQGSSRDAGDGEGDGDGEILLGGEYRFDGYWGDAQATHRAFENGWLSSGDVGRFENGRLRLVDRARDFIVTAGGKTLSPSSIENAMRASPYIAEIVVVGHARKFVSALVEIDFDTVADWARGQGLVYSGFTQLALHERVRELLQSEIERANQQLARVEQVKSFRVLPKALDPEEEGEPVTATRKVKRGQMLERFSELVESMYDSTEEALLRSATGQSD